MKLQAVFWDYPKFRDETYIRSVLTAHKHEDIFYWIMARFLEHGRVVDALEVFDIDEIAESLEKLPLSDYAQKNGNEWSKFMEAPKENKAFYHRLAEWLYEKAPLQ